MALSKWAKWWIFLSPVPMLGQLNPGEVTVNHTGEQYVWLVVEKCFTLGNKWESSVAIGQAINARMRRDDASSADGIARSSTGHDTQRHRNIVYYCYYC